MLNVSTHRVLEICGICLICEKKSAWIYSHADLADLADFLFRCYYVVHECTIDLRNLRNQRGKKYSAGIILTQISQISQIFIQILSLQGIFYNKSEESALSARE